ncbi:alpha-2,3-sialyltransferase [Campylobacter jejuni]|nr:alpha-2,3-sialyltransferase [Campylobacter jejuni]
MRKNKILIMGASNSILPGGLRAGLSQSNVDFDNLSIGGSIASSKIYTILKYKQRIKEADLVILECNLADVDRVVFDDIGFEECIRNTCWLYEELYKINEKVLNLLLVNTHKNEVEKYIRNIHKLLCNKYGFNSIDMHSYYESREILNFFLSHPDPAHQISTIMYNLGKNIVTNIENFKKSKINIKQHNPLFLYLTPLDLDLIEGNLQYSLKKHPLFQECQTYRIELNTKLKFPTKYSNFILIGMHTYNEELKIKNWMKKRQSYGNIAITNDTCCIVKAAACYNTFLDIKKHFIIDKNTYIKFETNKSATENSFMVVFSENKKNTLNYIDVSAFLLADQNGKFDFSEEIKLIQNENITIDKEYDFTYLVPPVEDYKTAIEEYNFRMDPVKLVPLQKQIKEKDNIISTLNQEKTTLQNELNSFPIKKQRLELANLEQDLIIKKLESKKLAKSLGIKMSIINPKITFIQANSAKARIQNHLSYKLGQALIANSKSILGYIRIPYVLSYIKDKHKFEQKAYEEKIKENPNLALPPLETYPDYNEALKEKECFTYKLGEALMQANKNWYGGGYIKFIFKDVPRLKREFGKKG